MPERCQFWYLNKFAIIFHLIPDKHTMASKQGSTDKITGNGGNTALYITKSNGSKQAEEDLKQLADIAFKANNPLELYAGKNLNSKLVDSLLQDSKIRIIEDSQFGDDIKNVMPVSLPLGNEPGIICRWASVANKAFNGNNVVVADGKLPQKTSMPVRYFAYLANFWSRLFIGTNAKMSSCEVVVLSKHDFKNLVIDKGITNNWQIASLAEKEGLATRAAFELQSKDFVFGDGMREFGKGLWQGLKSIYHRFYQAAYLGQEKRTWQDINAPVYRRIFGIAATLLLAVMCFISPDYNVTWDEPNHNNYSQDVLDYYISMGEDTSMFDFYAEGHRDNYTNVFYGMSIDVASSAVNRVLGLDEKIEPKDVLGITFTGDIVDSLYNNRYKRYTVDDNGNIEHRTLGTVHASGKTLSEVKSMLREKLQARSVAASVSVCFSSFKPHHNEFVTRHLLNAIIGFLGILFTALLVRLLSGWMPAIIALLAITCSPSFFGHCFNNPKDIPFATGYIMSLYYLCLMLKQLPRVHHQTKVMLAVAIGFTLSIRVQGVLPLGFLVVFTGLHWLMTQLKSKDKKINIYFRNFLVVAIVGYILGILFWPFALRDPISGPIKAFKEFSQFSYLTYYELFEGVRIFDKPWYYEPKLIMLTAPLAVLLGILPGLLLGWKNKGKVHFLMLALLVLATFGPSLYLIYKKSYVYNGWRHFIFIYPPLVALAVLGWYWLASLFRNAGLKLVILGIVALTFVKPGIWSIANHPYQYLYFNEIAGGVKGAQGMYELDYWNQTPRAAFEWLIKNKPEVLQGELKVNSNNIQEALKTFVPEGKKVKYAWTREYEWADNDWTYAIWTTRTLSKNQILGGYWPPKGTIHEIKVDGVTVAAVVRADNNYSSMAKKYLNKNRGDSALYFYEKAYAYNPLEEEYARGIANACKLMGKTDSAIMFYNKAIALRDGNYDAYQSIGEIYYTRAMMQNAEKPDPKLLDLAFINLKLAYQYKKNVSAPLYMGEVRLYQDNATEAKDYFNIFIQQYPNEGRGYLGLAKSQLMLNETDSASINLQYAIQLEPRNPEPYRLLGMELQKAGRAKEAEQFLNEYYKLSGMPVQP